MIRASIAINSTPFPEEPASRSPGPGRSSLIVRIAVVASRVILAGIASSGTAWSLPPGRAWAPADSIPTPSPYVWGGQRVEADSLGRPLLIATAYNGAFDTARVAVLVWPDSAWSISVLGGYAGQLFPEPIVSPYSGQHVVNVVEEFWSGLDWVIWTDLRYDHVAVPETVMTTVNTDTEFGGAIGGRRRWVARAHPHRQLPLRYRLDVSYSDTIGIWRALPSRGNADPRMCTIAPLSDTSAIVAYSFDPGLVWAIASGGQWADSGLINQAPTSGLHPRFRLRPSGGLWMLWSDRTWARVSTFANGAWERGESLMCAHPDGGDYSPGWCDASRDTAERPILAWGDLGYAQTYRDVGVVAFPTDSGWAPPEEIPGSEGIFTTPTIARDRNGDAWAAWNRLRQSCLWHTHTYVTARTSAPSFDGSSDAPHLSWTLSEPAPRSWWAVLRAVGAGDFEVVARVNSGGSMIVTWADDRAPTNVLLRYRIRRETFDLRFAWSSEEATWWPRRAELGLTIRGNPSKGPSQLSVAGASSGDLDIRLYDLQGRLALRIAGRASGSGLDQVPVNFRESAVRRGLYFVRIVDSRGRVSEVEKLALLR